MLICEAGLCEMSPQGIKFTEPCSSSYGGQEACMKHTLSVLEEEAPIGDLSRASFDFQMGSVLLFSCWTQVLSAALEGATHSIQLWLY